MLSLPSSRYISFQAIYDRFFGLLLDSLKKVKIVLAEKEKSFELKSKSVTLLTHSPFKEVEIERGRKASTLFKLRISFKRFEFILVLLVLRWGKCPSSPTCIKRRRLKRRKPFLIRETKITSKI